MDLEFLLKAYTREVLQSEQAIPYDATYGSVLYLDDDIKCHIEPHKAGIYFYVPLMEIPMGNNEKLFKSLLINQSFGHLTRQSYFCLDETNNRILLFKVLEGNCIDTSTFNHQLTSFIEICLLWKIALKETYNA